MSSAAAAGRAAAHLLAQVAPDGVATTVYFDYGTSTTYGRTTPSVAIGAGTTSEAVSIELGGLFGWHDLPCPRSRQQRGGSDSRSGSAHSRPKRLRQNRRPQRQW